MIKISLHPPNMGKRNGGAALDFKYKPDARLDELNAYTTMGKSDLELVQMMKQDFNSNSDALALALDLDSRGKRLNAKRQQQKNAGQPTENIDVEIARVNKEMADLIESEAANAGNKDFQQKAQEIQQEKASTLEYKQKVKDGWDDAVESFEDEMNIMAAQSQLNELSDDFVRLVATEKTPDGKITGNSFSYTSKNKDMLDLDPDIKNIVFDALQDLASRYPPGIEYTDKLIEHQKRTDLSVSMQQAEKISAYIAANMDDMSLTQIARLQKLADSCASGHFRDMSSRELPIHQAVQRKLIFNAIKEADNPLPFLI